MRNSDIQSLGARLASQDLNAFDELWTQAKPYVERRARREAKWNGRFDEDLAIELEHDAWVALRVLAGKMLEDGAVPWPWTDDAAKHVRNFLKQAIHDGLLNARLASKKRRAQHLRLKKKGEHPPTFVPLFAGDDKRVCHEHEGFAEVDLLDECTPRQRTIIELSGETLMSIEEIASFLRVHSNTVYGDIAAIGREPKQRSMRTRFNVYSLCVLEFERRMLTFLAKHLLRGTPNPYLAVAHEMGVPLSAVNSVCERIERELEARWNAAYVALAA